MTPGLVGRISKQMAALRDALVAERRKRSSAQDPKAGRSLLVAALARLAPGADLTLRLARCGSRPEDGKRFDCGSAACPACAHLAAKRQFKRKVAPALAHLPRDRLRFVTMLHLVTGDLDAGLRAMRTSEDRALRTIVRKAGVRWWGWREIELLLPADLPGYSEGKRNTLLAMGFPTDATTPIALFHTHSIVDLNSGDEAMLVALLRKRWSAPRQVHVQTLMGQRTVHESIRKITLYSGKARYTRDIGEDRREWLGEPEMVYLAHFLHGSSRGHQAYRFTINV